TGTAEEDNFKAKERAGDAVSLSSAEVSFKEAIKCYLERNELANDDNNVKRLVGGAGVRRRVRPVQLVRPEAEEEAQREGGSSGPRYVQTAGNVCTSADWERRPRQVQDERTPGGGGSLPPARRRERRKGCHSRHFSSMHESPTAQWGTLVLVRADGARRFQR
ncbi:MAG: hypothetical protein BJ554DRAFT_7731, partial [Olpidium bornovanus]